LAEVNRENAAVPAKAVKMEEVGDRAMDTDEALALSCRLEPDHASFSSSYNQMRILRSVI
jgi:hypothetical protein